MNVAKYVTENMLPTPKSIAAGTIGSSLVSAGISWKYPKYGEAVAYIRLRALGFQFQKGSSYWHGGPIWRMPLWARATGWGVLGYQAHSFLSHEHDNTGLSMYDVMDPTNKETLKFSFWG